VCFVPTASGDADHYVVRFYRAFGALAEISHVSLFRRDRGAGATEGGLREHLLEQDVIYVGGGSVVSLLGAWRAHGLDRILEECWRNGTILCGGSAGSLWWFQEAVTAFHGPPQTVLGLGFLPFVNCVHYDAEPERRREFHEVVGRGTVTGYGVDDGCALHFVGTELHDVVSSKPGAGAYRVEAVGGEAVETPLPARDLGAPLAPTVARRSSPRCPRRPGRSSRWAAAASRWSPETRSSTSSSPGWRTSPCPGCCSCRPRPATPRGR
jgi:peptidase E